MAQTTRMEIKVSVVVHGVKGPIATYVEDFEVDTVNRPEHIPLLGEIQTNIANFKSWTESTASFAGLEKKDPPKFG